MTDAPSAEAAPAPVSVRHSIAAQVLRVVFGLYLLVVAVVTALQVAASWASTKDAVREELQVTEATFAPSLEQALWEMNQDQVGSIVTGIARAPAVVGVRVVDDQGAVAEETGEVRDDEGLFWHEAPLVHHRGTRSFALGTVTLYSSSRVVFARVRFGVLLLVAAAAVQTLLFGLLFLWAGRVMLSRPLRSLTRAVEAVQLDRLEDARVTVPTTGDNELKRLEQAFNRMIGNLLTAREELQELHGEHRRKLEREVETRTRELRSAKDMAEVASLSKSVFLANMSHELRTPLSSIIGFTQLMERDANLGEQDRRTLSAISRNGEHLLTLINSVLEMSKIEAGETSLDLAPFDLHLALRDIEAMTSLRASERGLKLTLECSPEVPRHVRADEGKLRQVLINLVGNAVKFTDRGEVRLAVRRARPGEGAGREKSAGVRFEVSDTGRGVRAEDLDRILEPFGRSESTRARQGTGLGLAISRGFVELMGGELRVESRVGQGTTASFEIPLEPTAAAASAPRPSRRAVVASDGRSPDGGAFRILVVDDNDDNRSLLRRRLEPLGFAVREARDGVEGVRAAEEWHPHLVLMDLRMPAMDGYEATQQIRAASANAEEPVIVAVTAHAFEEERSHALREGFSDFIRKPFSSDDILAAIGRHLGVRYVYEEEPAGPADEEETEPLEVAAGRLPEPLRKALRDAVEMGDLELIGEALAGVRAVDGSLADSLAACAGRFEYAVILEALSGSAGETAPGAEG